MNSRPLSAERVLFGGGLLGIILIQAGWALVVPPFRGLDEHDHAYKAAAVSRGDWSASHRASDQGWGEFVAVPEALVAAAQPVCEELRYTTPDNCSAGRATDHGLVEVASSASRYNPAFYFLIGLPSRAFSGAASLYAMRATAAAMCAAFLILAAVTTRRWARTQWPLATVILSATPMMLYSTAVAAPNGIEVAGALLVWTSLIGLARDPNTVDRGLFVTLAGVGAVPLTTVRTLGPLWLGLIALTVAVMLTAPDLKRLLRERAVRVWLLSITGLTVLSAAWTVIASTNAPGTLMGGRGESAWSALVESWVLWLFQAVAAFPSRDGLAPLAVYAIAFSSWWIVSMLALKHSGRRERIAAGLVVLMSSLIPVTVVLLTYEQAGPVWQGRYGYPYAMGFILISGLALDRMSHRWARTGWPIWAAAAVMLSTQVLGQLHVLRRQVLDSPLANTEHWLQPTASVVIALNVIGTALLALCLSRYPLPRALEERS